MNLIKKLIKKILPKWIIGLMNKIVNKTTNKFVFNLLILRHWKNRGKPVPPPHYAKELIIKEYQKLYNINIFIETGTYLGQMVYAMRNKFKKIYSIELDRNLWKRAVKKFKNQKNINILLGDSGKILNEIIPEIKEKAIF